jgi:hypothetical protein
LRVAASPWPSSMGPGGTQPTGHASPQVWPKRSVC